MRARACGPRAPAGALAAAARRHQALLGTLAPHGDRPRRLAPPPSVGQEPVPLRRPGLRPEAVHAGRVDGRRGVPDLLRPVRRGLPAERRRRSRARPPASRQAPPPGGGRTPLGAGGGDRGHRAHRRGAGGERLAVAGVRAGGPQLRGPADRLLGLAQAPRHRGCPGRGDRLRAARGGRSAGGAGGDLRMALDLHVPDRAVPGARQAAARGADPGGRGPPAPRRSWPSTRRPCSIR